MTSCPSLETWKRGHVRLRKALQSILHAGPPNCHDPTQSHRVGAREIARLTLRPPRPAVQRRLMLQIVNSFTESHWKTGDRLHRFHEIGRLVIPWNLWLNPEFTLCCAICQLRAVCGSSVSEIGVRNAGGSGSLNDLAVGVMVMLRERVV